MEIKILGTGCPNCKTLESRVRRVIANSNIQANIIKVEDIMSTPGLVVDEKVISKGRLP